MQSQKFSYNCLKLPVIWVAIEFVRLNSGRIANIEERVSKLAASSMLSIFPQVPILVYIGYFQEIVFPADCIFSICMLLLMVVEFIFCFQMLRRLIKMKTLSFYRDCIEEASQMRDKQLKEEADVAYWSRRKMEESLTNADRYETKEHRLKE